MRNRRNPTRSENLQRLFLGSPNLVFPSNHRTVDRTMLFEHRETFCLRGMGGEHGFNPDLVSVALK